MISSAIRGLNTSTAARHDARDPGPETAAATLFMSGAYFSGQSSARYFQLT